MPSIATLAFKILADAGEFTIGMAATKKEVSALQKIVADTEPHLDRHARQIKVLGAMLESEVINYKEYNRAVAELNKLLPENVAKQEAQAAAEQRATEAAKRHQQAIEAQTNAMRQQMRETNGLVNQWRDFGKSDTERWNEKARSLLSVRQNMGRDEFRSAWEKLRASDPRIVQLESVKGGNPFGQAAPGLDYQSLSMVSPMFGRIASSAGPIALGLIAVKVQLDLVRAGFQTLESIAVASGRKIFDTFKKMDDLGDVADKLGLSPESLSRLKAQGALADTSFEAITGGVQKMLVKIGDAMTDETGGSADAFRKIGIDLRDIVAMSPEQAFERIGQQINELPNKAAKLNAINDIFGKGNSELVLFFENQQKVKQLAEETGAVMSGRHAADVDTAMRKWVALGQQWDGLWQTVTGELAPSLGHLADAIRDVLKDEGLKETFVSTFQTVAFIIDGIASNLKGIAELTKSVGSWSADKFYELTGRGDNDFRFESMIIDEMLEARKRSNQLDEQLRARKVDAEGVGIDVGAAMARFAFDGDKKRELSFGTQGFLNDLKAATQAIDDSRTEWQKYGDEVDKFQQWFRDGIVTEEQYLRLLEKAGEALDITGWKAHADAVLSDLRKLQSALDSLEKPWERIVDNAAQYNQWLTEGMLTAEQHAELIRKQSEDTLKLMMNTQNTRAPLATMGTQEYINALERNDQRTRSEKLLGDISTTLRHIEKKKPLEVEVIGMGG